MQSDGPWRTFVFRLAGIFVALIVLVTGGSFGFWLVEGRGTDPPAYRTHSDRDQAHRGQRSGTGLAV